MPCFLFVFPFFIPCLLAHWLSVVSVPVEPWNQSNLISGDCAGHSIPVVVTDSGLVVVRDGDADSWRIQAFDLATGHLHWRSAFVQPGQHCSDVGSSIVSPGRDGLFCSTGGPKPHAVCFRNQTQLQLPPLPTDVPAQLVQQENGVVLVTVTNGLIHMRNAETGGLFRAVNVTSLVPPVSAVETVQFYFAKNSRLLISGPGIDFEGRQPVGGLVSVDVSPSSFGIHGHGGGINQARFGGQLLWKFKPSLVETCNVPTLTDSAVYWLYTLSSSTQLFMSAVDAETGQEIWTSALWLAGDGNTHRVQDVEVAVSAASAQGTDSIGRNGDAVMVFFRRKDRLARLGSGGEVIWFIENAQLTGAVAVPPPSLGGLVSMRRKNSHLLWINPDSGLSVQSSRSVFATLTDPLSWTGLSTVTGDDQLAIVVAQATQLSVIAGIENPFQLQFNASDQPFLHFPSEQSSSTMVSSAAATSLPSTTTGPPSSLPSSAQTTNRSTSTVNIIRNTTKTMTSSPFSTAVIKPDTTAFFPSPLPSTSSPQRSSPSSSLVIGASVGGTICVCFILFIVVALVIVRNRRQRLKGWEKLLETNDFDEDLP